MSLVTLEIHTSGAGILTLADPNNLNAMGDQMARDFAHAVAEVLKNPERFSSIILTGAGRAFSAGGDLQMLESKTRLEKHDNERLMLEFYSSFLQMRDLPLPIIAAINGAAVGAGLCVASACDIRIASDNAKLGFTFVKLGLHPGMGATYFLPKLLGAGTATELLLTGRMIDAHEALRIGLVSRVSAPDQLLTDALAIAQEMSVCGPLAIKQLLATLRSDPSTLRGALEREALCQSENYASADFAEGIKAIREKRPPRFARP